MYHNHDFEFKKLNGEYLLDILYRDVPEDLLKTQIDTCWANVGGEDPAEYLRKYKGRSPLVHLKDFVMPGKKPAKLYELIGVESEQTEDEQDKKFELRPLGYGVQDIPEILKAAAEAGAEWVIVEQDHPSMNKTPMECAKISIDFLKSL